MMLLAARTNAIAQISWKKVEKMMPAISAIITITCGQETRQGTSWLELPSKALTT